MSPGTVVRAVCFCADCRAADLNLGQPDPAKTGVDLVQVSPSDVSIDSGEAHLALFRLYPSGLLRWYADCCKTPMFNTTATPKIRLVAVRTNRIDHPERAGPVRARAFVPKRMGKRGHEHPMRMIWPVAVRSLAGLISGDWRNTVFFDPETRNPVRDATILTQDERSALGLGPQAVGPAG